MNAKYPLSFELAATAVKKFLPALEISIAGVLVDFGLDESSGQVVAAEILKGFYPLLNGGVDIHCAIRLSGEASEIRLWCDPPRDLTETCGILKRSNKLKAFTSLQDVGTSDNIKLKIKESETEK